MCYLVCLLMRPLKSSLAKPDNVVGVISILTSLISGQLAESKNLHALLKYESTPHQSHDVSYTSDIYIEDDQFDIIIADTEDIIQSSNTVKHKVNYLAGHLEHKFQANIVSAETEHEDDHRNNSVSHKSKQRWTNCTSTLNSTFHTLSL